MSSQPEVPGVVWAVQDRVSRPDEIQIQELHGIEQARDVERLQIEIWRGDEGWIVPSHVLLIVAEYGGILLGARIGDALVGFVLGFLAQNDGKLFHASHMLGVLPDSRHHGIGAALKWQQRQVARSQGLDLMRWTFDPLEARNAYFNLHKLGATCRTYRPDYYGPMQDDLNRDLPSDRLLVEWDLRDAARNASRPGSAQSILRNLDGGPQPELDVIDADRPIAIEIPRDFQTIKRDAPEIALEWRLSVRQAFTAAFRNGYSACDFRDGGYVLLPQKADGA